MAGFVGPRNTGPKNLQKACLNCSINYIDFLTRVEGTIEWCLTRFYGEPNRSKKRRESWRLMRTLAALSPLSWCLIDVNTIVNCEEMRGGDPYPN